MGICWNCGNVGHKSFECNTWKANEVESEVPQGGGEAEGGKDAMSFEIGAIWNLCPVEVGEPEEGGRQEGGEVYPVMRVYAEEWK
eukprot:804702-Karenia_brevis.AAC.1